MFFGRCPLLGQLFKKKVFYSVLYSITLSVALLSAAVVAAAAAGCQLFKAAPLRFAAASAAPLPFAAVSAALLLLLLLQLAAKLLLFAAPALADPLPRAATSCYNAAATAAAAAGPWAGQ